MGKRRIVASACAVVAFSGAFVVATGGPAGADPKPVPGQTAVLDCGSGPMDITVAGNGAWTPAHVTGSTKVFVPVAFGESTNSFVVLDGPYAGYTGSGPAPDQSTKGGVRAGQSSMACTFRIEGTFFEPNFQGNIAFTSEGTVWVMVTRP
jgi:hypothetical protein